MKRVQANELPIISTYTLLLRSHLLFINYLHSVIIYNIIFLVIIVHLFFFDSMLDMLLLLFYYFIIIDLFKCSFICICFFNIRSSSCRLNHRLQTFRLQVFVFFFHDSGICERGFERNVARCLLNIGHIGLLLLSILDSY
jgi:hypothetical protein